MAQRGYRTILLQVKNTEVSIYASARVADALEQIVGEAPLYEGVKIMQILEAAYNQGKKDGAREVFDEIDGRLQMVRREIPHRNPGRPRKR